jgi:osmotically-inducible protein OsmY
MKGLKMKTDIQLKNDVTEELKWEPTISSTNVIVTAKNGVVTLSGTVPHYAEKSAAERATQRVEGVMAIAEELEVHSIAIHSDAEIAQAVVTTLKWHVWVPSHVQATVENGWVTLAGCVNWEFQRSSAKDSVRYLAGVKGVSNNITLTPNVQPTAIKDAIEKALKRDAEIDAKNIDVSAVGGKVTLAGTVASFNEREEAGTTAWRAPGVTSVENNLAVSL